MTSKQRSSDIVLLIDLTLNQRHMRHSFKTNGKSTRCFNVMKANQFSISFSFEECRV